MNVVVNIPHLLSGDLKWLIVDCKFDIKSFDVTMGQWQGNNWWGKWQSRSITYMLTVKIEKEWIAFDKGSQLI